MILGGALLYILSPIDLIPDTIPVVGWLDDIGIANFTLNYVNSALDTVKQNLLIHEKITGTQEIPSFEINTNNTENDYNLDDIQIHSKGLNEKLNSLGEIVNQLQIPELQDVASPLQERLNDNRLLNIMVVGRYSTGKSSLINALIGKKLLPSSPVPTTKAITFLTHGEQEYLYSEDENGEITIHDKETKIPDIKNTRKIFAALPDVPYSSVTIIDTPGLEDPNKNVSELTLNTIPDSDALIVVLDAVYLQSRVEFDFIDSIMKSDKERKLFIVINKIDQCEADKERIIAECRRLLVERGIHIPRIYAISAKNAITDKQNCPAFLDFEKNVRDFLSHGIKAEAVRHVESDMQNTVKYLIDSCDNALSYAEMEKGKAQKTKQELQQTQADIEKTYQKQKRQISGKFSEYKYAFLNDFSLYMDTLKSTATKEINQASLETLKNSDDLAMKLKQKIVAYLDAKLGDFQNKIQTDIENSKEQIRVELSKISLPIKIEFNDYTNYTKLFLPTVVGASFFFMGFFSFIWVTIAAVVGQNFFEKAIADFLSKFSINKIRVNLCKETEQQLNKITENLKGKLNDCFDNMHNEIEKSFSNALNGAVSPILMTEAADNLGKIDTIRACREHLTEISK